MGLIPNIFTGQLDFTGSGGAASPAQRYTQVFNATTDWGSIVAGHYIISILAATHSKGVSPNVQIYELISGSYNQVLIETITVDLSGNIELSVPSSPDLRFAGIVIII